VREQLADEVVHGTVNEAFADGGPDVAGVVLGVAGVVGTDVVVIVLAGPSSGNGVPAHPAVALLAADPRPRRVVGRLFLPCSR
jgi:hypothetical protein